MLEEQIDVHGEKRWIQQMPQVGSTCGDAQQDISTTSLVLGRSAALNVCVASSMQQCDTSRF